MSYFVFALARAYDAARPPRRIGQYRTRAEAWAASRRMIDDYLCYQSVPGMSAQLLYDRFRCHAAVPFICTDAGGDDAQDFNPLKYALMRCEELCGGQQACA